MNYKLLLHTVRYLKPKQIRYQIWRKIHKSKYCALVAPMRERPQLKTEPIVKPECYKDGIFTFLNCSIEFTNWNENKYGALWTNNQCYFDWLGASTCSATEGRNWIDRFIEDFELIGQGRRPYSTALRMINWVKFFCNYPECVSEKRENSLWSQLMFLKKNIEWQTMGNHVLEDTYALYIGACYFGDKKMLNNVSKLLIGQLKEQILHDGAHYEQSPMYHCILLDRLLDCINISGHTDSADYTYILSSFAERMLGHLETITWADKSIPMLNDSANKIAPMPVEIFDYARRLGLKWEAIPMKECGFRKMMSKQMEAIVDVGNVMASYQPGHTHADSLNYELRIDGSPFIVDTGISTYNKNERRQLERSTIAHNCVSPQRRNSSEVWGGFRVGKRCHAEITKITDSTIVASHNGFSMPCKRKFEMTNDGFVVEDWYDDEAVSYIHLAEGADETRLKVNDEGLIDIQIKPWKYSTEYNRFHNGKVIEIKFKNHLKYMII